MLIGAFGVLAYRDIKNCGISSDSFYRFYYFRSRFKYNFRCQWCYFYLTNDIVVKTLLFFIIGSLVYITGYRQYKNLYGLAKREPFFGVAFVVMILAIGGVPPFSGFPGKVFIFKGAVENGNYIGLTLMILTSLIGMFSLFRIFFTMYLGNADKGEHIDFKPIPKYRKGLIGILVAAIIGMGLAAPLIFKVTDNATHLNMDDGLYEKWSILI